MDLADGHAQLGGLSAADLAAALVVSTALSWVIESQELVCRRRPHHGSQLRNDARSQNAAYHYQPDEGVV